MRKDLTVGDLRNLPGKPLVAVLASLRAEGLVFTVAPRATYVSPAAR